MATAGGLLSEEHFLCSICLDVFTQPVSLPCGHNFCKACITDCWNSTYSGLCQCPMCKEKFNRRPELRVNCFISEMADHFRKSVQVTDAQEREANVPWEILCDLCIDPKMKAVKSCLVCLTSFCETHLEPHHRVANLKTHQLVEPLGSMESRMCKKHNKILELFCRKEKKCICMLCSQTDHRSHDVVALEDESGKRKEEIRKTKNECEQKIQERERKLQEIRRSAELNKEVAEKETADGVEVLTALVASIQKRLAEIFEVIDRKQREVQFKAELSTTELQREITELQMTCMECEQLSNSQDHLQVLLSCPTSPSTSAPYSNWSKLLMDNTLSAGTVRAAVAKMEKTLNEGIETLIKQLEDHHRQVSPRDCSSPQPCSSLQPPNIKPPSLPPPSQQKSRGSLQLLAKQSEEHHQVRPRPTRVYPPPPPHPPPPPPPSSGSPKPSSSLQTSRGSLQTLAIQSEEHHQVRPRPTRVYLPPPPPPPPPSSGSPKPSSSLQTLRGRWIQVKESELHQVPPCPPMGPLPFNTTCDVCACNLSFTHHHHCTLCRNYDLCPACFSNGYHMEHIVFLKIVFGDEPYL